MDLCHIAALKDIQLENTEEIKAEENDDKSRYDIHPKAVFLQKSAESTGQCTHHHKDEGETEDKAKGVFYYFFAAVAAACKIADVNWQHRQQARGHKCYDAL